MWDVFRDGMLATDVRDARIGGFAGFAQGIVATVEVLALLSVMKLEDACMKVEVGDCTPFERQWGKRTLSLFWMRSFLFGSFPYSRKSFCSSGVSFYGALLALCHPNSTVSSLR